MTIMILMWGDTMSDLISRSALYDKLIYDTTKTATVTGGEYIATWRIADVIAEAPTIDAVPVDKISFTDLYLANGEAIATFKFGNQGITIRKKCEDVYTEEDVRDAYTGGYSCGMEQGMGKVVVHGRWVVKYDSKKKVWCSVCDHVRDIYTQIGWHYCPNCGAKMDGETDV